MARTDDEILDDWAAAKSAHQNAAPGQKTAAFGARGLAEKAAVERFGLGRHLKAYEARFRSTLPGPPVQHGSGPVSADRLTGSADTDYFYFFCPNCADRQIMRVLDHHYHEGPGPVTAYPDERPKQGHDFTLLFKLYCPKCKRKDDIKIGNTGWQSGQLPE